jgi:hypothetical protein
MEFEVSNGFNRGGLDFFPGKRAVHYVNQGPVGLCSIISRHIGSYRFSLGNVDRRSAAQRSRITR